jgi:hypothetical protein
MNIMLLIFKALKTCLRLILSFWLVQNLSSLTEGFSPQRVDRGDPTSGNDNHWNGVRYE